MKYTTILLSGVPHKVKLIDLSYCLDRLFDTDEIGTFKLRDLSYNGTKRQIALDFRSGFDAFAAQERLDRYHYELPDGKEYTLCAKITRKEEFIRQDSVSPERWQREVGPYESCTDMALPMVSDDTMYRTKLNAQAQLELLQMQKRIIQTKREVLSEKRKLEREHKCDYDSEDEPTTSKRRRKSRFSSPGAATSSQGLPMRSSGLKELVSPPKSHGFKLEEILCFKEPGTKHRELRSRSKDRSPETQDKDVTILRTKSKVFDINPRYQISMSKRSLREHRSSSPDRSPRVRRSSLGGEDIICYTRHTRCSSPQTSGCVDLRSKIKGRDPEYLRSNSRERVSRSIRSRSRESVTGNRSRSRERATGCRSRSRERATGYRSRSRERATRYRSRSRERATGYRSRSRERATRYRSRSRERATGYRSRSGEGATGYRSRSRERITRDNSSSREKGPRRSRSREQFRPLAIMPKCPVRCRSPITRINPGNISEVTNSDGRDSLTTTNQSKEATITKEPSPPLPTLGPRRRDRCDTLVLARSPTDEKIDFSGVVKDEIEENTVSVSTKDNKKKSGQETTSKQSKNIVIATNNLSITEVIEVIDTKVLTNNDEANNVKEEIKPDKANDIPVSAPGPFIDLTIENTSKPLPKRPKFVLVLKKLMKQMKHSINKVNKKGEFPMTMFKYALKTLLKKIVAGKGYLATREIIKYFRAAYPIDKDEVFVKQVLQEIKLGKYGKYYDDGRPDVNDNNDVVVIEKKYEVVTVLDSDDDGDQIPEEPILVNSKPIEREFQITQHEAETTLKNVDDNNDDVVVIEKKYDVVTVLDTDDDGDHIPEEPILVNSKPIERELQITQHEAEPTLKSRGQGISVKTEPNDYPTADVTETPQINKVSELNETLVGYNASATPVAELSSLASVPVTNSIDQESADQTNSSEFISRTEEPIDNVKQEIEPEFTDAAVENLLDSLKNFDSLDDADDNSEKETPQVTAITIMTSFSELVSLKNEIIDSSSNKVANASTDKEACEIKSETDMPSNTMIKTECVQDDEQCKQIISSIDEGADINESKDTSERKGTDEVRDNDCNLNNDASCEDDEESIETITKYLYNNLLGKEIGNRKS